jgi:hypothetical protein
METVLMEGAAASLVFMVVTAVKVSLLPQVYSYYPDHLSLSLSLSLSFFL